VGTSELEKSSIQKAISALKGNSFGMRRLSDAMPDNVPHRASGVFAMQAASEHLRAVRR